MSKILLIKLNSMYSTGELFKIADDSYAFSQVLSKLGYSSKSQYISIVRDYFIENDIDYTHFTSTGKPLIGLKTKICINCGKTFKTEYRSNKEQITCSKGCSNSIFRSGRNNGNYNTGIGSYRKIAFDVYPHKCARCGYENILALEVHHKDKNRNNNSIENLEILCCNCHTIKHKQNSTMPNCTIEH